MGFFPWLGSLGSGGRQEERCTSEGSSRVARREIHDSPPRSSCEATREQRQEATGQERDGGDHSGSKGDDTPDE